MFPRSRICAFSCTHVFSRTHALLRLIALNCISARTRTHCTHAANFTRGSHQMRTEWGHSEFKSLGDVRNNASHRVIWRFSLGNTWHELAAPLWVLSAAIPIRGAAFPRNARHARTLPALHDARAFPRLKRPIAPAIQKHPSTVHQAL
jgi:hypothetical protein